MACLGNDFRDIERMFVQFRILGKPFQNLFLISVRKRMSCLFIKHFLLNLFRFFARETIFLFDPRKSAMDVTAKIAATPAATAITIFPFEISGNDIHFSSTPFRYLVYHVWNS